MRVRGVTRTRPLSSCLICGQTPLSGFCLIKWVRGGRGWSANSLSNLARMLGYPPSPSWSSNSEAARKQLCPEKFSRGEVPLERGKKLNTYPHGLSSDTCKTICTSKRMFAHTQFPPVEPSIRDFLKQCDETFPFSPCRPKIRIFPKISHLSQNNIWF